MKNITKTNCDNCNGLKVCCLICESLCLGVDIYETMPAVNCYCAVQKAVLGFI